MDIIHLTFESKGHEHKSEKGSLYKSRDRCRLNLPALVVLLTIFFGLWLIPAVMVMIPRSTIRLVSVFVLGYSIIVSWFLFQSTKKYYIFDNSNHETNSVRNLTSWRAWEGEILPLKLQCNPTFSRLSTSTKDLFLTLAFGIHYLAQVWVIVIINSDLPVQSDFECVFYKQDQNDLLSWNHIANFSIIGLTLSKLYVFPEIVKLPAR